MENPEYAALLKSCRENYPRLAHGVVADWLAERGYTFLELYHRVILKSLDWHYDHSWVWWCVERVRNPQSPDLPSDHPDAWRSVWHRCFCGPRRHRLTVQIVDMIGVRYPPKLAPGVRLDGIPMPIYRDSSFLLLSEVPQRTTARAGSLHSRDPDEPWKEYQHPYDTDPIRSIPVEEWVIDSFVTLFRGIVKSRARVPPRLLSGQVIRHNFPEAKESC